MGTSPIDIHGSFSIAMFDYRRVYPPFSSLPKLCQGRNCSVESTDTAASAAACAAWAMASATMADAANDAAVGTGGGRPGGGRMGTARPGKKHGFFLPQKLLQFWPLTSFNCLKIIYIYITCAIIISICYSCMYTVRGCSCIQENLAKKHDG